MTARERLEFDRAEIIAYKIVDEFITKDVSLLLGMTAIALVAGHSFAHCQSPKMEQIFMRVARAKKKELLAEYPEEYDPNRTP